MAVEPGVEDVAWAFHEDALEWRCVGVGSLAEANEWTEMGVAPSDLRVWQMEDFSNDEVLAWSQAGVRTISLASGWRDAGWVASEAAVAYQSGFPSEAWLRVFGTDSSSRTLVAKVAPYGFGPGLTKRMLDSGRDVAEVAAEWERHGFDAASRPLWSAWSNPEEAGRWVAVGFDPNSDVHAWDAYDFTQNGIGPAEGRAWHQQFMEPDDAAQMKIRGVTPAMYANGVR